MFGVDLLASLTYGKLSDNSPSVKVLSLEEAATSSLSAPFRQLPGYSVTRNISINRGQQYTYFTYKVVSYDDRLRTFHNLTTSNLLSNNQIIKALSANFKTQFESQLGGLQIKSIR